MTVRERNVLEVRDLSVRFGALMAVSGVTFDVAPGHITSLIGPNGAGKSTLFNLVSGAIRPIGGSVRFDGVDVTGEPAQRLVRRGLSRSFQITNLFAELTVVENLRLGAQILEPRSRSLLPPRFSRLAQARVEELIERFELADRATDLAGTLSHGEQRRLEIAVAVACRPKLLLLDEPTQGMSHTDTLETAEIIRGLSRDLTIVLIEHDIDLVMTLSDHVVVLHQGKKLAEGRPQDVRGNPVVQEAYFGTHDHAAN